MRVLFVCTQNRLRSPTAEQVFSQWPGVECASAGVHVSAEVPLSGELIDWAEIIFVMERAHRDKMRRKGIVRVEVQVNQEDAELLRAVARALLDPDHAEHTRAWLRKELSATAVADLKGLIESAPLEDTDLERPRDVGRRIEL